MLGRLSSSQPQVCLVNGPDSYSYASTLRALNQFLQALYCHYNFTKWRQVGQDSTPLCTTIPLFSFLI